jgi:hypothetical protein
MITEIDEERSRNGGNDVATGIAYFSLPRGHSG